MISLGTRINGEAMCGASTCVRYPPSRLSRNSSQQQLESARRWVLRGQPCVEDGRGSNPCVWSADIRVACGGADVLLKSVAAELLFFRF